MNRFPLCLFALFAFVSLSCLTFAAASGEKWEFITGDGIISSPTVGDGKIFAGSGDGKMYALDMLTGQNKWSFTSGGPIETSPLFNNGFVYFGSNDNNTYSLNATTGQKVWEFRTDGKVYSSPISVFGLIIFGSSDGRVYALNSTDGTQVWNFSTGAPVYSSPSAQLGVVYVGSNDRKLYALNTTTGAMLWSFETGGAVTSSPRVFNNHVYFGSYDGKIYCIDAFNGNLSWSFETGDKITATPAVSNSKVLIGSSDGNFYVLNASNGAKMWLFSVGSPIESSPYYNALNNIVYFGADNGYLYALNGVSGRFLWSFSALNGISSSPLVQGSLVYFTSYDKRVYAVSTIRSSFAYPADGDIITNQTLITLRGNASADAGVRMVQVQIGTNPEWKNATGISSWNYTIRAADYTTGIYRIRVRAADINGETELEPLSAISITISPPKAPTKQMNVSFPSPVHQGDALWFYVTDLDGNPVPFARVDIGNSSYYDISPGDGIVNSSANGTPIIVNIAEGEIKFNVVKENYSLVPGIRQIIDVQVWNPTPYYISAGIVVLVLAIGAYLWKQKQEPDIL